jgi:hypothetical protein
MDLKQKISDFVRLGLRFREIAELQPTAADPFAELIQREQHFNGWFTPENVRMAFRSLAEMLSAKALDEWVQRYPELAENREPKKVGLILAGNIPLVGFHDVLSVLISGHHPVIKCSRDDNRLMPAVLEELVTINPQWEGSFTLIVNRMDEFDAVIATGSNNSARYFEHYFGHVPNIIRKNRSSVAVLHGEESPDELEQLANDVFTYFGLGCRNVTKVFAPRDFDIDRLFGAFFKYREIINHSKYANNYDYHKALWMLNRDELIENGFLLVKEDEQLVSPVGSLFLHRYDDPHEVSKWLDAHTEEVQCVVGKNHLPFGKAQHPELWDYADGVDTLAFLIDL